VSNLVRIGIVGTSWWADMMYLPSLKNHPGAQLVAICGRNPDRANEMASKYAIPHVFTDYRTMIETLDLDAVVIAVPDDMHYPITMAALDARLHVLCEKPLALNADHARVMYEKAEAVGVKHMVLFTWRWLPIVQRVKRLVEDGYIGRCFHAQFQFLCDYGRDGQYAWRFDRQRSNGILGDLGSHMIDLARWIVGDISRVNAHLAINVDRVNSDDRALSSANDAAVLTLEFANGAQGILQVSAVAHLADRGGEQRIMLHGEAGTLEMDVPHSGASDAVLRGARHDEQHFHAIAISDNPEENVTYTKPPYSYFTDLYTQRSVGARQFIDAILEDRPVSPSFFDGLKVQEVIDAAIESHANGCWVTLPLA
jgi:predicted dehydrogenase